MVIDRVAGADRVQTSVAVSLEAFPDRSDTDREFEVERVAGADRFATAQAIAARLDAEIDVTQAVIVKGRDGDPDQGFADAIAGADVTITARLGGEDRFETSAMVWDAAVAQGANPCGGGWPPGATFPDALTSGPAVALGNHTFVLMPPDDLDASAATSGSVLTNAPEHLDRVVIVGGEHAVTPAVEADIETLVTDDLGTADYCLTVVHNNHGESQLVGAPDAQEFGGVARFAGVSSGSAGWRRPDSRGTDVASVR